MFSDGSVEQGKPYCIASSADVTVNSIDHGSAIVISGVTWYCIGKTKKNDGLYRLILSKTHES